LPGIFLLFGLLFGYKCFSILLLTKDFFGKKQKSLHFPLYFLHFATLISMKAHQKQEANSRLSRKKEPNRE